MFKRISRVKNYFFLISNENLKIIHFKKHFHAHCSLSSSRISIKENPAIMKIDTPQFHSVFTPELDSLAKLFEKYGYELRIVGGAVRDLLNGETPHDLDFATTATPDQMKEMFEKEGIRMLNTKGEKHGTITPRINDKANFEVTTLRTDVKTDGRHAEVEFTKNWQLDALRRDLTINSMYLGFDGTVYDYFGGYEDLKNKRILFVGDASKRIQEDYLRILRYFRFYGRIADNPDSHDEETLKAIQQNASGLEKISGERIWSELKRIVIGNFAVELMKKMLDVGLSPYIGLGPPEELDIKCFENTCRLKDKYSLKNITYIAALLPSEEKVLQFHARCKLSAHERDLALFISNFKYDDLTEPIENPLRRFQLIIVTTKMKREQIREFTLELFRFKDREDLLASFESWTMPRFPVNGNQLKEKGIITGKQMGFVLHKMKELWVESDFKLTEDELIEKLPEIVDELKSLQSRKRKI